MAAFGGEEMTDRRGDLGAGRVGTACGAAAWSERQSGFSPAPVVPVAGRSH
jgi:hypothetical protein